MEADVTDEAGGDDSEPSTDELLEALLVDDAKVEWDPATGRPKIVLDRERKSAYDRP